MTTELRATPILAHSEWRAAAMELFTLVSDMAAERTRLGLATKCLEAACRIAGAAGGVLYMLDAAGRNLVPVAGRLGGAPKVTEIALPLYPLGQPDMKDPRTWCAFTGEAVTIVDAGRVHGFDRAAIVRRDARMRHRTTSLLACPLRGNDDRTIGVLEVTDLAPTEDNQDPEAYLRSLVPPLRAFAYQAAIAISNITLLERNRELVEEIDRRNVDLQTENQRLRRQAFSVVSTVGGLLTRSPAMRLVLDLVAKAADSTVAVLILGETGTGKELVARLVHGASPRQKGPFVPQNCAALPAELLESELFGYRKGAFTGAMTDKKGLFEAAHGGTLFLDEIGDMPLALQTKLLRVLQDGEVRALGAVEGKRYDVRIVAATNVDLRSRVADGRFREDLFYRISVFPVRLPLLRDRPEDISLLAEHFATQMAARHNKEVAGLSDEARTALEAYAFPGNVRELRNIIERAVIIGHPGQKISLQDLPPEIDPARLAEPQTTALRKDLRRFEAEAIVQALNAVGGNRTHAASALGMSRRTLQEKIARYGLGRPAPSTYPGPSRPRL